MSQNAACRPLTGAQENGRMTARPDVSVNTTELRDAFEFVSAGLLYEHSAYMSMDIGTIYLEPEDYLPEDIEDSDSYIGCARQERVGSWPRPGCPSWIANFRATRLRSRLLSAEGGISSLQTSLESRGMLERWYDFGNTATEDALRAWCEANGIQVSESEPPPHHPQGIRETG